ncbi:AzlD domain-containing protein [Bacillus sp. 2205SS5-2]|uniref:AzlD domain-containing protein n=1 Tax=Bacillus sp. 2205SS5-2 TaxID=3109031 RepID=UPI003007A0DD
MITPILLVILGMAVVTYLPRMAPFLLLGEMKLPPFLERVLRNVPYAILGALIFPGAITLNTEDLSFGLIGITSAFLLAFLGWNVIFVVLGSIGVLTLYSL